MAGFLAGSDGYLYGTTAYGGSYGAGTAFRLSPDGTFSTMVQFNGYNGANPQAALVEGRDGFFYGSAQNGGANGQGVLFRFGTVSPLQITTQPAGQSVYEGATIQFVTSVSGSAPLVYRWRKNGINLTDTGSFSGSSTYALTLSNLKTSDAGTYSLVVSNALEVVTSLDAVLQVSSSSPLLIASPTNQTAALASTVTFSVTVAGSLPMSFQWQRRGTNLTDTTNIVGSASSTLILSNVAEIDNGLYTVLANNALGSANASATLTVVPPSAAGTRMSTMHWFSSVDGGPPNGLMAANNGLLYGTTKFGGTHRQGSVFSLTTNGLLTTIASFDRTNGSLPKAALIQGTDGNLYGTTPSGGTNSAGNIFKMTLDGAITCLYSFTGDSDGATPYASLVQGTDGSFYGTAQEGGANSYGTLFKITSNGVFTCLYSFANGADGGSPINSLVQGADGNFYGMTAGGALGYGTAFRMSPQGLLTPLYAFTGGNDGYNPAGALVQDSNGTFYGLTAHNLFHGYQFYGTIFSLTPSGSLSTLYVLNSPDGSYPAAGLIQGTDGNFYGTGYQGGVNGAGTIFQTTPAGVEKTLASFDGYNNGGNPDAALVQGADGCLYGTTSAGGPGGRGTIFRLAMTSAPQILTQPAAQTVAAGSTARFSVYVSGAPPFSWQWRYNGTNLINGANLAGATERVLTLKNVAYDAAGTYSVALSNALGSALSSGALLTVVSPIVFQASRPANGAVTLAWTTSIGQNYQIQYKTNLNALTWGNLGNATKASSDVLTASDILGTNTQRYYRVIIIP